MKQQRLNEEREAREREKQQMLKEEADRKKYEEVTVTRIPQKFI